MFEREIQAATARCAIKLSDALPTRKRASSEDSGEPVRGVRTPQIGSSGIRFQQCGGGRRVIRKQRRHD